MRIRCSFNSYYLLSRDVRSSLFISYRTGRVGNSGRATSFFVGEDDSRIAPALVRILSDAQQVWPFQYIIKYPFRLFLIGLNSFKEVEDALAVLLEVMLLLRRKTGRLWNFVMFNNKSCIAWVVGLRAYALSSALLSFGVVCRGQGHHVVGYARLYYFSTNICSWR